MCSYLTLAYTYRYRFIFSEHDDCSDWIIIMSLGLMQSCYQGLSLQGQGQGQGHEKFSRPRPFSMSASHIQLHTVGNVFFFIHLYYPVTFLQFFSLITCSLLCNWTNVWCQGKYLDDVHQLLVDDADESAQWVFVSIPCSPQSASEAHWAVATVFQLLFVEQPITHLLNDWWSSYVISTGSFFFPVSVPVPHI